MRTISVVTAAGPGCEQHIEAAAASLYRQVLPDNWEWEWVICLDGPSVSLGDPELELRARKTALRAAAGPAMARNRAASLAHGEIIRNLDSDDVLLPDALAGDIGSLSCDEIHWTTSEAIDLYPDGKTVGYAAKAQQDRIIETGTLVTAWRHSPILPIHPTTLACRRTTFWSLGGYPALPVSEDSALLVRMSTKYRGIHRAAPTVMYRKWPGQMTATERDPLIDEARISILEALVARV